MNLLSIEPASSFISDCSDLFTVSSISQLITSLVVSQRSWALLFTSFLVIIVSVSNRFEKCHLIALPNQLIEPLSIFSIYSTASAGSIHLTSVRYHWVHIESIASCLKIPILLLYALILNRPENTAQNISIDKSSSEYSYGVIHWKTADDTISSANHLAIFLPESITVFFNQICTASSASFLTWSFVNNHLIPFFTRQKNVSALMLFSSFSTQVTILSQVLATFEALLVALAISVQASTTFSNCFHFTNTLFTIARSATFTGKSNFAINLADNKSSSILQYCLAT